MKTRSTWDLGPRTSDHHSLSPVPCSRSPRRRARRRSGIVLLLIVSLLALFVLLGATFTLIALHALHASNLELKLQPTLHAPTTALALVMRQVLCHPQAR